MLPNEDFSAVEEFQPDAPIQIEVRGKLFEGLDIALVTTCDSNNETASNAKADMLRRMFERQRVVFEHRETMLMLANKRVMLREVPGMIREYTEKRTREFAAEQAKWQSRWIRDGKRGEFRQTAAQASWVDQFNDESEKKLKEFEMILADYPGEITNLEARIARCKRVLDGIERTDLLLDLDPFDTQREAAE